MNTISITKNIVLEPKYLNGFIEKTLLDRIRHIYEGRCIKRYGYFVDIQKLVRIIDNRITKFTGNVEFNVEFLAVTLLPIAGAMVDALVCMVLPTGVLVEVESMMNVMLTVNNLKKSDYHYCPGENVFSDESGNVIEKGDNIKVCITNVKYDNGKFICIGKLL